MGIPLEFSFFLLVQVQYLLVFCSWCDPPAAEENKWVSLGYCWFNSSATYSCCSSEKQACVSCCAWRNFLWFYMSWHCFVMWDQQVKSVSWKWLKSVDLQPLLLILSGINRTVNPFIQQGVILFSININNVLTEALMYVSIWMENALGRFNKRVCVRTCGWVVSLSVKGLL